MVSQSVKPLPRRRQSRRHPQRVYSAGETVKLRASFFGGTRTITARIERISEKPSTIPGLTIKTYVVRDTPTHSIVMSSAEFAARIVESN
jgi:hypothetical protein